MTTPSRRDFLTTAGALAGAAAIPSLAGAAERPRPEPAIPAELLAQQERWDMSWADKLTAKHKQVFDLSNLEMGLVVVRNWYDAWEKVYGLRGPEAQAVVGIASNTFPINAGDALWSAFPIGEAWKVNDPRTGKPSQRNVFLEAGTSGNAMMDEGKVKPLQARGAIFWQCNNALMGVSARLAGMVNRPVMDVYRELRAGLNPGVIVVPAHTMLIGVVQEKGCTYEFV